MRDIYREAGRRRRVEREKLEAQRKIEQAKLHAAKVCAAVSIQLCFRMYMSRKTLRTLRANALWKEEQRAAATKIQSRARGMLARQYAAQLRDQYHADMMNHSAKRIQCRFRGYNARKRMMKKKRRKSVSPKRKRRASIDASSLPSVHRPVTIQMPSRLRRRSNEKSVPTELPRHRDRLPTLRRSSVAMYNREELKLREPQIGDTF
jgi:hypothetical protein